MDAEDALLILTAKTAMLERLVRLLLWDRLTEKPDPVAVAKELAKDMISQTEARIAGGFGSRQEMIATEQLQTFFDVLIREVSEWRPPQG